MNTSSAYTPIYEQYAAAQRQQRSFTQFVTTENQLGAISGIWPPDTTLSDYKYHPTFTREYHITGFINELRYEIQEWHGSLKC